MADTNSTMRLEDYQAPDYKIRHIDLEFDIRDGETFVTSVLQVERNGTHTRPLKLDGQDLELLEVSVDGFALNAEGYTVDTESLTLDVPESCVVKTRVRIKPEENTALEGLYKSGPLYCTQCEAEGFRRITYFIDRPDNMATYTTKIIADKKTAPVLLSNGNKIDEGDLPDGRAYTVWSDPFPKPSYLFAVVAGDLDVLEEKFTTQSGRDVTLRVWAEEKDLDKLQHAMDSLKASMTWDEEVYGREYDLDLFNIVAVSYFNMGAMENKSLNIFNTKCVLANPRTQTDLDFDNVNRVVAHEYFHNWTGNRVTCRDWFQLTLKEGLTVFRDQEYFASTASKTIKRIADVDILRNAQFTSDAGPLAHPIRPREASSINNFYTSTIYEKGAEVIRMIHTLLGAEGYRKGTDLYFDRHDGQAVTCEDFIAAMADSSGRDFTQFMLWYEQAGTPEVSAAWKHDVKTGQFTLTLAQSTPATPGQPAKKPMLIPVNFGLVGADGKDVALDADGNTTKTLELTGAAQNFTFDNVPEGSVPSILRNFSAPVKLDADYSTEELRHLMTHDSDGFNRWDAGQRYMRGQMLEQIGRLRAGKKLVVSEELIETLRALTKEDGADKELLAAMLSVPSQADLEQAQTGGADPIATARVRSAFIRKIASGLRGELVALYDANDDVGQPYRSDPESRARRTIMNLALSYLAHTPERQDFKRIQRQYQAASHMTDQSTALRALLNNKVARKSDHSRALREFYTTFRDEALVIDKWFSLQAGCAGRDAGKVLQDLRNHADFDIKNPNRVRALYRSLATNPSVFHAKDGSGYQFMADFIIELDRANPQVAAGLVGTLTSYAAYTAPHCDLMKGELARIADTLGGGVSRDLGEKLRKAGVMNPGGGSAAATVSPAP